MPINSISCIWYLWCWENVILVSWLWDQFFCVQSVANLMQMKLFNHSKTLRRLLHWGWNYWEHPLKNRVKPLYNLHSYRQLILYFIRIKKYIVAIVNFGTVKGCMLIYMRSWIKQCFCSTYLRWVVILLAYVRTYYKESS